MAKLCALILAGLITLPNLPAPSMALPLQGNRIVRTRHYNEVRSYEDGKLIGRWRYRPGAHQRP